MHLEGILPGWPRGPFGVALAPGEHLVVRRRIQIERLSRRLAGEDTGDELRSLLLRYVGLSQVPPACRPTIRVPTSR